MPRNPPWTMDETLRAFALYLSLTKRERNDKANPHILELSRQIGRTPSSVYMKLANISAYDPNTIEEGNVGLPHGGKKDAEVWDMWREQGDSLLERAVAMLPDETRRGLGLTPAEAIIAEYERNPVRKIVEVVPLTERAEPRRRGAHDHRQYPRQPELLPQ